MKEKVIKITHSTGVYRLIVPTEHIDQITEHLNLCLSGEQAAFTSGKNSSSEKIFPADFLRNSFILIEDHKQDDVVL